MSAAVVISALVLGLGGSLHCLGMCGPLVLAMPFGVFARREQLLAIIFYNIGRALAYGTLGALVFWVGSGMNWLGISQYISVVLGIVILVHILWPVWLRKIRIPYLANLRQWQSKMLGKTMTKSGFMYLGVAGFLNGLLPCGLVYIALSTALVTNTELPAYHFMLLFGLGTVPAMATLALVSQKIPIAMRLKLRRITPMIGAVVAVLLVVRGLGLGIPMLSPSVEQNHAKTEVNCCKK
jgi:sulfite exporter TauE/SafE